MFCSSTIYQAAQQPSSGTLKEGTCCGLAGGVGEVHALLAWTYAGQAQLNPAPPSEEVHPTWPPPRLSDQVLNISLNLLQRSFNSPKAPTINEEAFLLISPFSFHQPFSSILLLSSFQILGLVVVLFFIYKILILVVIFDYTKIVLAQNAFNSYNNNSI